MLRGELIDIVLAGRIIAQQQHGGFREGPLEMDMADLLAAVAIVVTGRFPGALDQSGVGGEILYPWEAVDGLDLIEQGQGEDFTHPWNGAPPIERVGIMLLGQAHDGQ